MSTTTVIEYVAGKLVRDGKTSNVTLRLTIQELMADESPTPVARAIARTELTPTSGLADGAYTLRYVFDGKQHDEPVRVQYGMLLSA